MPSSSRLRAGIERPLRVARLVRRAAARYDSGVLAVGRRAVRLYRREGFSMAEAAPLGLLDPRLPEHELDAFASRTRLRPHQARLNGADLAPLTEDKAIFYRTCALLGLPIPKLYALFFRGAAGWSSDGSLLATREDWCAFLERGLPDEFVLKPSRGHWGIGVDVVRRSAGSFLDSGGSSASAGELYDRMLADPAFDSFVLQERLRNHPELVRLSGAEALQTTRMITLLDGEGGSRLLYAGLKLVLGEAISDNIHDGTTGNGRSEVRLEDGTLTTAVGYVPDGLGVFAMAVHPRTGVRFEDVRLPFWDEACALVGRASREFLPLRTIGWDVALTPAGPVIVEANAWWGPPNEHRAMARVMRALTECGQA